MVYFRGLFHNRQTSTRTSNPNVVLPDRAEKLLAGSGSHCSQFPAERKLIRLEDPRFEKEFCVYGEDQVEARYILTPSLMERILAFKNKWNKDVSLRSLIPGSALP
jgi:hypothetical protein